MTNEPINFSNPQSASKEDLAEIFDMSLSFGGEETEVETVPPKEKEKLKIKPETPVAETPVEVKETEEQDQEEKEGLNPGGDGDGEPEETENGYLTLINKLTEAGIIEAAYEDFDAEAEPDEEMLTKLLTHNQALAVEKEMEDFFSSLSDTTRRILEFDINSEDKGQITTYLQTLVEENNIKSLSIENEFDQEKILREWYRSEELYTQAEVDEKLSDLKDANLLEKEAKRIKPKLDLKAEEIAKVKEKEQRDLRELEDSVSKAYSDKLVETLKKGKVGGIPVTREEATRLLSILSNDKIEVKIHGNKKAMMTPMEYMLYYHKYDQRGNIENVAMAALLLSDPKKFEEAYAKRVETKNTEEFVRQQKYNNKLKLGSGAGTGSLNNSATSKQAKKVEKDPKWRLKI